MSDLSEVITLRARIEELERQLRMDMAYLQALEEVCSSEQLAAARAQAGKEPAHNGLR